MASTITAARRRLTRLLPTRAHPAGQHGSRRRVAAATAVAVAAGLVPAAALVGTPAHAAPVGQGFNLNAADLRFILKQIKIAERHAATATAANPCGTLLGNGPDQIPTSGNNAEELPWGLRTVDGTCNNLMPGQEKFGAADQVFPRRSQPHWEVAEAGDPDGPFGPAGVTDTSYAQTSGPVFDSEPRVISNLVVDQTNHNPAAVAAAGADPSAPKSGASLSIPNVAPDVGLSAPFNSVFTLFGQFFDHGLDLVTKTGDYVYIPLKNDDPLVAGRDGVFGTTDDLPESRRFMVVSRSVDAPGPDGVLGTADDREALNLTTPFVDQNQTYSSHPSHQVFLREYANNAAGKPMSTGHLLEGQAGGMATWSDLKEQARTLLGIDLRDTDVLDVPLLATDQYGEFERGPNGYPLLVTTTGEVEGDPLAPISTENALRTGHGFLVDIAHHAVPVGDTDHNPGTAPVPLDADGDEGETATTADDRNSLTYDNEMLDAHFVAGDGRVNENIGLTAIHHIFHSEHNRLAGDENTEGTIKHVLVTEDPTMVGEWKLPDGTWDGERIFQAAKFVTEMEYQHLAFEEFARKVQPMVNAFGEGGSGYDTSLNAAIKAEFAHAAYRFGHSMLTETVARRNSQANGGGRNDISLLGAFLNPPRFTDGGAAGQLSADEAAGSVFRGMSRQVGNEIDEFVTGALRSNLLGLPLDLGAINIARAREAGVPTLNDVRRQFYAEAGNSALKPYESWVDFGFSLKHRESLVNFVAAYGTHPSVVNATTVDAKRTAAELLVAPPAGTDPATIPADAGEFVNGSGSWSGVETGINDVDLWTGGLAEKQMVFGGLLGSTLNYIFELQMEELQFGDRFYYLSRTAGLNLLTQLEGNSFAELIMRNTDVQGLPADVFSRPDYVFNVGNLGTSGPIVDDQTTEDYDEGDTGSEPGMHLSRMLNGTLRYSGPAHTVFNGTSGADRVWASEGDDTVRGNDGDDWMEGGDGVDNLIGGLGDDIMNDLFGDDTIKGGDGDDAISSGQGFGADLNQGGRDKDFIVGGNDMTETFAGPGDDFVFAGDGEDTVFGDDGDDWIEGGKGPFNLLQGDNGNPFQDDPNGGHDVLDGDGGEMDFDSEGGDDIMLLGPGIQRAEGMLGFDWATHKGDPQPADTDMLFTELLRPGVEALRDRLDMTEALSGWKFDDVLRGDSRLRGDPPAPVDPAPGDPVDTDPNDPEDGEVADAPELPEEEVEANPEEHTLDADGIARVNGLAALLPAGTASFNTGNILLGGGGDDTIEGRGGDDIVDGDRWLNVQLQAPDLSTPVNLTDTIRVDGMKSTALVENGVERSLEQLVFAGRIDPGDIQIVRAIQTAAAASSSGDVAVFSDVRVNYDCLVDGSAVARCPLNAPEGATVTVTHAAGTQADGTDTLTNIEKLVFTDSVAPGAVTNVAATAGNTSATVTFSAPTQGVATGFLVQLLDVDGRELLRANLGAETFSHTFSGLANGTAVRFQVTAANAVGDGPAVQTNLVTPDTTVPGAPTLTSAAAGDGQVTVRWQATSADNGGSPYTGFTVLVDDGASVTGHPVAGNVRTATISGLGNGEGHWFKVVAHNAEGDSPASNELFATPATRASAPQIGTASSRDSAAVVRWQPTTSDGAAAVTSYRIKVVNAAGDQVGRLRFATAGAVRKVVRGLVNGRTYRFQVAAVNEMGRSRFSRLSNRVVAGSVPDAPLMERPRRGRDGGRLSATARWNPPATAPSPRLTGYVVTALRMGSRARDARVLDTFESEVLRPRREQKRFVLPAGLYRFQVVALNSVGQSRPSRLSRAVRPR